MAIPIKYNLRSLMVRRVSTLMTALSIALVVAVFVVVVSLARGLETTFMSTGEPLNLMVMRKGSQGDLDGGVRRDFLNIVKYLPGIQMGNQGAPVVSPEQVVMVYLPRRGEQQGSNVMVRGLSTEGLLVRPKVRLVEGRMFRPGVREVIVSRSISERFQNTSLGDRVRIGKGNWAVVGIFEAQGTIFDSEIWTDVNQLSDEFRRTQYYSVVRVRASDKDAMTSLAKRISDDPQLDLSALSETKYYSDQKSVAAPIRILGILLSVIMSIGACFAAMNTMYAAVMNRTGEIATMRVLGFSRGAILLSFLVESLLLAFIGGLIGCLIAWPANFISTGTAFGTFREVTFNFRVTPGLLASGMIFSLIMGVVGGLLPARLAARQSIVTAMRGGAL